MVEKEQNPSTAEAVEAQPKNQPENGIDFSSVKALANSDYKVEKWYTSLGYGILEKLISVGLFLLGFVLDIFKTLWVIIKGIFVGVYKIGLGVYHFFRNVVRMCREGDKYVKMSTFCSGLGNIKGGQVADGVIFLGAEVLFIVYMAAFGVKAIADFILLGEEVRGYEMDNNSSIRFLISGVMTIVVIAAYVFVWYSALKSAHDNYIIRHNFRFLQAHADQVDVVENIVNYPEFSEVVDRVDKDGKAYKQVIYKKPKEIRRIARETYGFSKLSARYISYLPLKDLTERPLRGLPALGVKIKAAYYKRYDKVRNAIRNGKWSSVFAKFLEWEFLPPAPKNGYPYVHNLVLADFNRFRHTYDKYNDYLSVVRDSTSLLRVIDNPELIEKAIYAEDEVSAKNGVEPIARGTIVKPKVAASRIVGAFECPYSDGVTVATYYQRALKEQAKTGITPLEKLKAIAAKLHENYDTFVRVNRKERLEGIHETHRLYGSYDELKDLYASGKAVFIETLSGEKAEKHVSRFDAEAMFEDMDYANKAFGGDEAKMREFIALRAERFTATVDRYETYPFHGQPIRFKKKAKQYLDEKFAVTVMTLPVLGALITSVLPLLISIIIAFTNFTGANAVIGNFDWNMSAWSTMFDSNSTSLMGKTFAYILGWTLIWAIFATFSNYILGIVLALLINKKSIKFKKVYRMFFVVSIAIPQFITLLAMSKILGPGGPINMAAYAANPTTVRADTWWLNDPANQGLSAKICLILVNCWVGIPYTMLSTSGILMNIPEDLYESARIDGASPWTQFWKITMPYILFVTGPSLLTTFIGNINNFNVIYFLTGGGPKPAAMGELNLDAGYTDLLITFLFKITVNSATHQYAIGSVIGILVFIICAFFSLIMYSRMGSTKNEEAFQ